MLCRMRLLLALCTIGTVALAACLPVERVARPTLDEVRMGNARGQIAADLTLRPGEIQGEIERIDRGRREIHVIASDGRKHVVPYDIEQTHVIYHDWDYTVDNLEAGDSVGFQPLPRTAPYISTIRVLEPVQARSGPPLRQSAARARLDVVEGIVERVDHGLGTFELRAGTGRTITVSVPYNARPADIDMFRDLRRGDRVRVEGEFVNAESLQLLALLPVRER